MVAFNYFLNFPNYLDSPAIDVIFHDFSARLVFNCTSETPILVPGSGFYLTKT